jgi:hypothetical protein
MKQHVEQVFEFVKKKKKFLNKYNPIPPPP